MKYWTGNQILEQDRMEGESIVPTGHPAMKGNRLHRDGSVRGIYELEIVPGSMAMETFTDPMTFDDKTANCVQVIFRNQKADSSAWQVEVMIIPIEDFGLVRIPPNNSAYDRAMSILG